MKTIRLLPIALLLSGCRSMERIAADSNQAEIQIAALRSQAVVGAEWARTQAAASVAQSQAMSEVSRNAAWAAQLPWVVMAICVTVVIVAYIWYRSRIAYAPVYEPGIHVLSSPAQALPHPQYKAMREFAAAHGGQIVWTPDGKPLLQVDGKRRQLRITAKGKPRRNA